jgi:hypothetical protein
MPLVAMNFLVERPYSFHCPQQAAGTPKPSPMPPSAPPEPDPVPKPETEPAPDPGMP